MPSVPVATTVVANHAIKHTNRNRQKYSLQFLAIAYKQLRECVAKRMWKQNKKRTFGQIPTGQTGRGGKHQHAVKRQIPWQREGVWIILTKYQIPKFWNNFILGKYLTYLLVILVLQHLSNNWNFCIPSSTFCPESVLFVWRFIAKKLQCW